MATSSPPLLNFLHRIYQLQTLNQLAGVICEGLPPLIGGDNAIVGVHNGTSRSLYSVAATHPFSCKVLLPDINEEGLISLHPFWDDVLDQKRCVRTLSDLVSTRAWHENPVYREVYRHDNVQDQINTEIGGTMERFTTVGVLRSSRGFSTKEVDTFTQLRPHLVQALQNARMAEWSGLVQGYNERAWMIPVKTDGCIPSAGSESVPVLASRFGQGGRLPESVENWVREQADLLNRGALDTHLLPHTHTRHGIAWRFTLHNDLEKDTFLLCAMRLDVQPHPSARLSPREMEILKWVDAGKANEEIAIILDLSLHTVKTHLRNVFRKLGVENRTAAARQWREQNVHNA